MSDLFFCIKTTDRTILYRWQCAFRKEGWVVKDCGCLNTPCTDSCRMKLALIEVGTQLCKTPDNFREILIKRKPVATLVFAAAETISNSQIAKFLESGADDFIFKSIDERILVAKLKAHMRRMTSTIQETMSKVESSCGDIKIDRDRRAVKIEARKGKYTEIANLTEKELDILTMLVDNEKLVLSRESMLERLWGNGAADVYSECIDKHIESLRRKLGPYGRTIKTVYGAGYKFTGGNKA